MNSQMLSFGSFRLDPGTRELRHRGSERRLRAKSAAVLLYLAGHPNRLVTREELLREAWPDTTVSPTVLRVCIREIRVALGEEADRFLTTVPRRGYRFTIDPAETGATPSIFVGRDAELAELHDALARARSGKREVVFVTGDVGAGKTALIEHFLDELRARGGIRCARGQAFELNGDGDGCAAVLDALNALCDEAESDQVVRALARWAPAWLLQLPSRIDDETAEELGTRNGSPSWEGRLLELRQALAELAQETPLVLVLEDLQWADPSTIDALVHLTLPKNSAQLLVVGTHRPDLPEGHPLLEARTRMRARHRCTEVPVGALSISAVGAYLVERLAEHPVDDELSRLLHEHSGGRALHLVAIVDRLLEERGLELRGGTWSLAGDLSEIAARALPNREQPRGEESPEPEFAAERRPLTALCCLVTTPTKADPEDQRAVTRAFQESASGVLRRYDGHIAQYLVDGLVVYFGYPKSHEDDAVRAIRAGLEMQDALRRLNDSLESEYGARLSARIGIHTGPVVIDEVVESGRRQVMALGDAPLLATRLSEKARPGAVVVSAQTRRLARGIFVMREGEKQALPGFAEPVRMIEVEGATGMTSRLDVLSAEELTPLVGRDAELSQLDARFAQACDGAGQSVLLGGEAGIGKSRILHAFRERIGDRSHSWLECRCSPYDQSSPFHPLVDLVRGAFRMTDDGSSEDQTQCLARGLEESALPLETNLPLLAELFGLPTPAGIAPVRLAPAAKRMRLQTLFVEWLKSLSRLQPLVLVLEDLHWVDPSTREWLGAFLDGIADSPVLLLLNHRPEFAPPWPEKSHQTALTLDRLAEEEIRRVVRGSTSARRLPSTWVEEIVRRSDGVPLFAEELTRTVVETNPEVPATDDAATLHIPESLQASLMARLDTLGPVKIVAQLASAIGREFEWDMLRELSPLTEAESKGALDRGVEERIFHRHGKSRGATYLFSHALIRDAAYQSMLRGQRRSSHLRIAETLLAGPAAIVGRHPERIAHHLAEAGDAARAVPLFQAAARIAQRTGSLHEAESRLQRALDLLPRAKLQSRDVELELYEQLAAVALGTQGYGRSADAKEELASRLDELVEACPENPRTPWAYMMLVNYHRDLGRADRAAAIADRAVRVSENLGDEDARAYNELTRANLIGVRGRFEEALDIIRRFGTFDAETENRRLQNSTTSTTLNTGFGWGSWFEFALGRPVLAIETSDAAIAHLPAIRAPLTECLVIYYATGLAIAMGRHERAVALAEALSARAAENGLAEFQMAGAAARVTARTIAGHPEGTELTALMGPEPVKTMGLTTTGPVNLWMACLVERGAGHADVALRWAGQVRERYHVSGYHWWNAELHRLEGEILGDEMADPARAEKSFVAALQLARAQGAKSFELRAATSYAEMLHREGRSDEAKRLLAPIYEWFTEGHDLPDWVRARAVLEEIGA